MLLLLRPSFCYYLCLYTYFLFQRHTCALEVVMCVHTCNFSGSIVCLLRCNIDICGFRICWTLFFGLISVPENYGHLIRSLSRRVCSPLRLSVRSVFGLLFQDSDLVFHTNPSFTSNTCCMTASGDMKLSVLP
jgi:hypothetical protein